MSRSGLSCVGWFSKYMYFCLQPACNNYDKNGIQSNGQIPITRTLDNTNPLCVISSTPYFDCSSLPLIFDIINDYYFICPVKVRVKIKKKKKKYINKKKKNILKKKKK